MKLDEYYVGLMSGTSLDAVDAALVNFSNNKSQLIATHQHTLPHSLRQEILTLCHPGENAIDRMGQIDVLLGELFADSVLALLKNTNLNAKDIKAIGSHGQTIRHRPNLPHRFTLQIGDPNIIAAKTGITTVADFRRRDMALGGQAAPLAPAFHNYLFKNRTENIAVLNIGGIANITLLPADISDPITGFDTGPGNVLMNAWCFEHTENLFDQDGLWASTGHVDKTLLKQLLADPYFHQSFPKSTGREYFDLSWLKKHLSNSIKPKDVQATLLELTAQSIADNISPSIQTLWVCGGGIYNKNLMQRLKELTENKVKNIEETGISPDWVEAAAFAWLARQTIHKKPGNIPSVTGAKNPSILGAVYLA